MKNIRSMHIRKKDPLLLRPLTSTWLASYFRATFQTSNLSSSYTYKVVSKINAYWCHRLFHTLEEIHTWRNDDREIQKSQLPSDQKRGLWNQRLVIPSGQTAVDGSPKVEIVCRCSPRSGPCSLDAVMGENLSHFPGYLWFFIRIKTSS
jgi:hypothetical protein